MIRINLLGKPKAKGKRAASSAAAMEFENGSSQSGNLIAAVVVLAVALGAIWWSQKQLTTEAGRIQTQMQQAQMESQRLAQIKIRYTERQKVHDEYEAHVKVIDSLRASQSGPVELLTMVSSTVNSTDEVWLAGLNDGASSVSVEGVALSTNAVANLMTNLMKTGYFKSVEINNTFQDEQEKKIQAFNFSLTCEKQGAAPKKS